MKRKGAAPPTSALPAWQRRSRQLPARPLVPDQPLEQRLLTVAQAAELPFFRSAASVRNMILFAESNGWKELEVVYRANGRVLIDPVALRKWLRKTNGYEVAV